jgi:predicted AAA+ superfamily ATPase
MYIRELYDKIITRDLVQRRKIKNIKALKEIAILLISNYSAQFTYSSIRKSSSINSINTIKNYIDYLQEAYLGFVVEPFSYKIKARISLPKKFYLIDISFIDAIFGSSSPDLGKRLENIVYLQLRRFYTEIYYVKQTHYEVDFLIREGRTIRELIQVAWSLEDPKTREQELKALIRGAEDFKCSQLTLITMNHEESLQFAGYQIRIIPAWKWMLGSITPISGC